MKTSKTTVGRRSTWFLMLSLVLWSCTQAPDSGGGHTKHLESPKQADHDDHHEHGERRQLRYDGDLLARLKGQRCEHKAAILECSGCRYEVGAVELTRGLLEASKKDLVQTARAIRGVSSDRLALTGEVAFDEKRVVHISPRIKGVARRVFVAVGSRVKAGAPLLGMESIELGRLRSSYLQARARAELALSEFQRQKKLHADQISSSRARLQSQTALRVANISLAAARDQLQLIGFSQQQIKRLAVGGSRGGRMTLRSPMAGIVVSKHAVPGERITPDKTIFTVADMSVVWVWAAVYERDLARLLEARRAGRPAAMVRVRAFARRTFAGTVDYVGATMDESTRTVKVRVVVANRDLLLRPGMFARINVGLGRGAPTLLVPAEAVVSDEKRRFVFVRIGTRRFLRRDVVTGKREAGQVEVISGLKPGEEIVIRGAFLLKSDILREKMGAGCAD